MIGSIILLFITIVFIVTNNPKGLFIVIAISLFNDLFQLPLGGSVKHYQLIALLYSPKILKYWIKNAGFLKKLIRPLLLEYYFLIILGVIFGFLFPWRGDHDYLRSWSQLAEGRTIIQLVRFFSELLSIFLLFYWIHSKKISLPFILKSMSIILSIMVLIAIIDGLTGYPIRMTLFGDKARFIEDRFLGLCGEPRYFGRMCSYGLLFLLVMKYYYESKYLQIAVFLSIIGIVLSFSASTYLLTLVWFIVLLFYKTIKFNIFLIIGILVFAIIIFFHNVNDEAINAKVKIGMVIGLEDVEDKVSIGEPDFFTRFEVFDRAALNFFYKNPKYIITGVGPNLISIPASPYLTSFTYSIYGDNIDSVPHSFLVNLLSRSGLIGLFLWAIFFVKSYKKLRKESLILASFFVATFVSNLMVNVAIFYFYLGIILSLYNFSKNKSAC